VGTYLRADKNGARVSMSTQQILERALCAIRKVDWLLSAPMTMPRVPRNAAPGCYRGFLLLTRASFFVLLRARRRRLVFCSGAAVGGVAGVDVASSELRVPLSC
jgi:hypothetical protein